ncbi:MAG: tRNA lysidine(34) synthetase TilS, partial [Tannerellaceae bacterium]
DNSLSIEMAARELRYQWFEQLRNKYTAQAIVVAHHKDDNAETVLLNLIRGTGIRGLSGIKPVNGTVVRPFLCVSRSEILDYLDHSNLDYVTDSTNLEDEYTRNFIRLNVIPLLSKINPSVLDSINKTSLYLNQAEKVYTNAIQEQKQQLFIDNKVNIASLLELPSPKAFLFELLSDYGFNENQVTDIYQSLNAISGKFFLSKTHRVIKDRETLIITPLPDEENKQYYINEVPSQTTTPIRLSLEVISNTSGFDFERDKSVAYFDFDKITFPLQLRRWNQGDRFYPFGMKGAKKISDYFNDRKFSLKQKEATWLLCSAGDIVWIIGERSDNRVRVTDSTKKILKVKFFLTN